MKRIILVALTMTALLVPIGLKADMLTGGTYMQFPFGLSSSIAPTFSMKPTASLRLWNEYQGFKFGIEGTAFFNDVAVADSAIGWGAAAYLKVRSFKVGTVGAIHILAKGATSNPSSLDFSLDENQYEVGPVFNYQPGARKPTPSGWGGELGVFWMTADGFVDRVSVETRIVVDFE